MALSRFLVAVDVVDACPALGTVVRPPDALNTDADVGACIGRATDQLLPVNSRTTLGERSGRVPRNCHPHVWRRRGRGWWWVWCSWMILPCLRG
jgi:hypothetical protein